jgi:phosphoglycolate phosphatase-like HAD superfamily hydrolase
VNGAIVFAERAIAPGGDAIWPAALEHLSRRFASIRALDVAALPPREDAVPALEAWAGEDVSSWRLELGRFYDDHARVHLRRDPGTAALLASLRANGTRLAVYGQGPREASAVTLAFLGLDRRLDAVVLEPAGDGFAASLEALGVAEAQHVSTREELSRLSS